MHRSEIGWLGIERVLIPLYYLLTAVQAIWLYGTAQYLEVPFGEGDRDEELQVRRKHIEKRKA